MATARKPSKLTSAEVRKANKQAVSFIGRTDVLRAINQACEDPQDFKRLLTNPIAYFKRAGVAVPRGALITAGTGRISGSVSICVTVCFVILGFQVCVQVCGTIVF